MKKRRGHYCRICGRIRPNEKFSGKGRRTHVCKDCARLPRAEREAIKQHDEIRGYWHQSHISDRNVARLNPLAASDNQEIAVLAKLVLEVAKGKPYKKRRFRALAQQRPDLLQKLKEEGLIDTCEILSG